MRLRPTREDRHSPPALHYPLSTIRYPFWRITDGGWRIADSGQRTGATVVETAFVVSICLMFLFGIFEYGRYVMTLQTLTNAAREGARWAAVNTNDANANPTLDVQRYTLSEMAGIDQQLNGSSGGAWVYTNEIQVFKADPNTGNPLDANGNIVTWTSAPYTNAGFEQAIAVKITGSFIPSLPSFLLMGNTIPIQAQAIMYSEAN